jgi:carbohydrate-selective porin OprB
LSDDARLGTLQQVQEVFGRGQTLRLTQFWYDQKFIDGAIDWKIGRITFGEDFAAFSCDFQNLTLCGAQPGTTHRQPPMWSPTSTATRRCSADSRCFRAAGVTESTSISFSR